MKKTITLKLISILLMVAAGNEIFSQFVVSGEFRPRAEFRDGYKSLNSITDKAALFTSQRTRLNFAFKNTKFKTYLSLQDVRVWGSQKQLVGNEANGMSVHEAWAETVLGKFTKTTAKFGRQEIIIDDHRIFGSVGWAQQARSHDALVIKYADKDKIDVHVGFAYNNEKASLTKISYTKGYKTFQYLWLNKKLMEDKLAISVLILNKGNEVNNTALNPEDFKVWNNYTQTIGTHTTYKSNKFKIGFNGYYQIGAMAEYNGSNMKPTKLSAYLVGLDVAYKASDKLSLGLGYEMQSGNNSTSTGDVKEDSIYALTNHAFTPFFGTNHKFNGHMDYFYVGNHKNSVGLQDIYFKAKYKANKFYVGGDIHAFMSAGSILDIDQLINDPTATFDSEKAMSSYLGTELDLHIGFPITDGVKFKLGHSTMFGTRSMEVLKGGSKKQFNNWAYAQIVIKPTFFDSSKYQLKK